MKTRIKDEPTGIFQSALVIYGLAPAVGYILIFYFFLRFAAFSDLQLTWTLHHGTALLQKYAIPAHAFAFAGIILISIIEKVVVIDMFLFDTRERQRMQAEHQRMQAEHQRMQAEIDRLRDENQQLKNGKSSTTEKPDRLVDSTKPDTPRR